MKTRPWKSAQDGREGITFYCPGCGGPHSVTTAGPGAWGYNGDPERPSLSPSVLVNYGFRAGDKRCHSYVGLYDAKPGEIMFLTDCTHHLAGRTVPLPEWPTAPEGEPA